MIVLSPSLFYNSKSQPRIFLIEEHFHSKLWFTGSFFWRLERHTIWDNTFWSSLPFHKNFFSKFCEHGVKFAALRVKCEKGWFPLRCPFVWVSLRSGYSSHRKIPLASDKFSLKVKHHVKFNTCVRQSPREKLRIGSVAAIISPCGEDNLLMPFRFGELAASRG